MSCPQAWQIGFLRSNRNCPPAFPLVKPPVVHDVTRAMQREKLDAHEKASQINKELARYGTFAEIGAGQEVARIFFRAGGAADTVAKSMSAYDMVVSDAIYGPTERYVSRQRLQKMLEYEYALLIERLDAKRGSRTSFFVFADTVAARSFRRHDDAHGWLGVKFQTEPRGLPSEIIIHVRMLDDKNVLQQEALGIVGVNLLHAAFYRHPTPPELIGSLLDELTAQRIEVDTIKFSGPAFAQVDNRLMSLQLVEQGLTDSTLFTERGETVQAGEVLYQKPVLIERGSFRPVTLLNLDMLQCTSVKFLADPALQDTPVMVLMEMTLRNLLATGALEHGDFLARADLLNALRLPVLITSHPHFYPLAGYLRRYTKKPVAVAIGIPTLKELFNEKYYTDLEGGILESFGRLFQSDLRLYVYPYRDPGGQLVTVDTLAVAPHLRHLYQHLVENEAIQSLENFNEACVAAPLPELAPLIQKGDPRWRELVAPKVAELIQTGHYFGCP